MGYEYFYEGRRFTSIRQLALFVGINEKTLAARLRRGMSMEEACSTTDLRCTYYGDKSVSQLCLENDKDADLVRNRLKYGYSMKDALNKPKKITRQGSPVVVEGILYNTMAAAIRKYGLQEKESTIRRRIRAGEDASLVFAELRNL